MEATVNGSDWRSSLPAGVPGADTMHAIASYGQSIQWLVVTGLRLIGDPNDFNGMGFMAFAPLEAGTIHLGSYDPANPDRYGLGWFTRGTDAIWQTDSAHVGTVIIDRVDREHHVIEGRFEFTAMRADDGSTVEVKSGVFRCKLDVVVEVLQESTAPLSSIDIGLPFEPNEEAGPAVMRSIPLPAVPDVHGRKADVVIRRPFRLPAVPGMRGRRSDVVTRRPVRLPAVVGKPGQAADLTLAPQLR